MLKIAVFNTDDDFALALRNQLQLSRDARIVAEVNDPDDLISTVQRMTPDVVLVYLHPEPDPLLTLAARLNRTCPNTRIFAIADSSDPQLILTSMRSGMCEFLTTPVDSEQLHMALAKVAALKPAGAAKGKILATVPSTGGCGATFLAVNTACELVSSCDQTVAIVDMDFCGGQVATYLDLMPSFTLGDLAESSETLDPRMLDRVLIKHSSGLAVIARPSALAQGELLQSSQAYKLVTSVISTLTDMYDYVILDGLNPSKQTDLEILRMTDHILLVMNLLVPSIRNAHRMLEDMIQRHGLGGASPAAIAESAESPLESILLIINRLGRESSYLRIQDVEKTLQHKIFAQVPDDWRTVSRSINAGDPLALYAPNSKIRTNLVEVAMRLAGNDPDRKGMSPAARKGQSGNYNSSGLLGRMFHRATERNRGNQKNSPRSLAGVATSHSEDGTKN